MGESIDLGQIVGTEYEHGLVTPVVSETLTLHNGTCPACQQP